MPPPARTAAENEILQHMLRCVESNTPWYTPLDHSSDGDIRIRNLTEAVVSPGRGLHNATHVDRSCLVFASLCSGVEFGKSRPLRDFRELWLTYPRPPSRDHWPPATAAPPNATAKHNCSRSVILPSHPYACSSLTRCRSAHWRRGDIPGSSRFSCANVKRRSRIPYYHRPPSAAKHTCSRSVIPPSHP